MKHRKLLVVGLDGATFDLLDPWTTAGLLPAFARLLQAGARARLRSVPNTDTAPAWATFATGLDPANHSLFHELGWSADRRTLRPVRGADRRGTPFWRVVSDAGGRVIVINVPFTYPADPVRGVLLAGIDAPGVDAPGFCYPPDFIGALRRDVGDYRIESGMQAAVKQGDTDAGLADACVVAERHTDAAVYAMSQAAWNLAVIMYSLPDVVQHFLWQQMATGAGPQRDAIRDSYVFLDRQLGRLMAVAGDDTTLLVMSDHGFGPICATPDHLARWLSEHGFLRYLVPAQRSLHQRVASRGYMLLRRRLSEDHKAALRRYLPRLRDRVESDARFAHIDWSATTAYVGPSPFEVWINCAGREPRGIVSQGAEYQRVREQLMAALATWSDPATGKLRVKAVYPREEVYRGLYIDQAPDVTIEWNPEAAPDPRALEGNASCFDGDHQPQGILLAAGPEIPAGIEVSGARLVDLAPTILTMLEVPLAVPMDGCPVAELCG